MPESRNLGLVSMYLHQPVLKAHGISLRLEEGSAAGHMKGHVTLDPNTCRLNNWGDREMSTLIAHHNREAAATAMKIRDPLGLNRILWKLEVDGVSEATVHLIEYPDGDLWYLTVESETEGTMVVPLFEAKLFAVNPAGTVQTRYGVALRDIAKRGDVDEMRAEAELVRRALVELDTHPDLARDRHLDASHIADVHAALAELEDALANLKD